MRASRGVPARFGAGAIGAGVALVVTAAVPAAVHGQAGGEGEDDGGEVISGELSALTYNVAGLPEQLSGSDPAVNTPLISPLLNDYDLVLAQETWMDPDPPVPGIDFHHDDLISQVTHPHLSTPAPLPIGTDTRRAGALVSDGLNRMSRFPFDDLTRVMWEGCFGGPDTSDGGAADCMSLKGFSVARTTLAPGVEVDVYNLHGEAGNTEADRQARQEGFAQMAAFLDDHSDGRAVIVGGDFNLRRSRAADAAVLDDLLDATGLSDVCEVVDCGADDDVIDKFMFRSGGGVTIEPLTHSFERDRFQREDGEPLSDHDPLEVTFAWSATSGGPGGGTTTTSPPATSPTTTAPGPATTVVPSPSTTPPGGPDVDVVAPPARPVLGTPTYTG